MPLLLSSISTILVLYKRLFHCGFGPIARHPSYPIHLPPPYPLSPSPPHRPLSCWWPLFLAQLSLITPDEGAKAQVETRTLSPSVRCMRARTDIKLSCASVQEDVRPLLLQLFPCHHPFATSRQLSKGRYLFQTNPRLADEVHFPICPSRDIILP